MAMESNYKRNSMTDDIRKMFVEGKGLDAIVIAFERYRHKLSLNLLPVDSKNRDLSTNVQKLEFSGRMISFVIF